MTVSDEEPLVVTLLYSCLCFNIFMLKTGYIEFAWLEYYADAIHSAIVNPAG